MRTIAGCVLWLLAGVACAHASAGCADGSVYDDVDGDGMRDAGEPGLPGIRVSDGESIVATDARGRYRFVGDTEGRTLFVVKPAGFTALRRPDGLPDTWRNVRTRPGPTLKYGGMRMSAGCRDFALRRASPAPGAPGAPGTLEMLVFGDPQPKTAVDVGYYLRDIVEPLAGTHRAALGLSLGDIVNDDLSLYPAMNRATARLGVPWLHVAGNHDLDFDATRDEDSLSTFRDTYGADTYAWEEPQANFVVLDDVVYRPGESPAYIGGLRESQFAFLGSYLAGAAKDRLLVVALHIPLFEDGVRDTFRDADRARLFGLLRGFPHVLVLSAHSHTQRHVMHDAATGWHGAQPLHEYNVGAACGAFWSGAKDAAGIPDATMSDGTPNGYATLSVAPGGTYALAWHPARGQGGDGIGLHAPKLLRRGAYPAWGVFANVYMGRDGDRVEYRVDGGAWKPMKQVRQPDPRLLAENARDDAAPRLRGYDRSPEAEPSSHLWRGALPTDLAVGVHAIEMRAFDAWRGELRARTQYALAEAAP